MAPMNGPDRCTMVAAIITIAAAIDIFIASEVKNGSIMGMDLEGYPDFKHPLPQHGIGQGDATLR
ncbi:MAG TPA: hypothetical protein VMX97_18140 [Hyphomicrobiaceae bacterium]|nr:hypothetical protein [Hyphomicrobiaceae bacterium]